MLGGWILFIQQLLNGAQKPVIVQATSVAVGRVEASSLAVSRRTTRSVAVNLVYGTSKAGS